MNREPFGLYLIRFIAGLGLFVFMLMLYWSSTLVEKDLKKIQNDLLQIKNELSAIQMGGYSQKNGKHIQAPSFPNNLLKPDPFYAETLPKIVGPQFTPHGVRKEATIGKPDTLHPFSNWNEISSWLELCTVSLTTLQVGIYETYVPEMALSMELKNSREGKPEFWMTLRQDVFWLPLNPNHFPPDVKLHEDFLRKHQVTAHDFKFYFDAVMNPHVESAKAVALRLYYQDIEKVEAVDDFTLVVRWKTKEMIDDQGKSTQQMKYSAKLWTGALRPFPRFVYQYFADGSKIISNDSDPDTYRTNTVWAQNFSHHWAQNIIVSCGPWLFDGMTDNEIRFKRNPHYFSPDAVLFDSFAVTFRNSPDAIWEEFKTGSLDRFDVPPNLLGEYDRFLLSAPYQKQKEQNLGIKRLDYLMRGYNYIGWNEARPLFDSKKVRQALTLSIDRERIIRQNLNGMGLQITGPFFPYSPSYDPSLKPYPYNPQKAKQLLREEGWSDTDGDGIIDKMINGYKTPFIFTLTYYVKNPTTKSICEYVATALKEVGIICNLNGVDMADLSKVFEGKDFDALFLGWALGTPPEDPKQLWDSSGAKQNGSSNAIGFANQEVDAIIAQLEYEQDIEKRNALYHRFDAIIYDEAPYTFLYAPKIALIYRDYLQNVFIPAERQDLIPGANVGEPQPSIFFIK